jgi:hypothetical protein
MSPPALAKVPNLGRRAANCRKRAQLCRTRAAKSQDWQEEDAWLEYAAHWVELAKAFDDDDRLLLN